MPNLDRQALGRKITEARKLLISQGGRATLRFGTCQEYGLAASNHRKVVEAMCDLWNAAPELLGLNLDPVVQPSTRISDERHPAAEIEGDMA